MAEQQSSYEFVEVKAEDILRDREEGWVGFTRFATWSVILTAAMLILMGIFLV